MPGTSQYRAGDLEKHSYNPLGINRPLDSCATSPEPVVSQGLRGNTLNCEYVGQLLRRDHIVEKMLDSQTLSSVQMATEALPLFV